MLNPKIYKIRFSEAFMKKKTEKYMVLIKYFFFLKKKYIITKSFDFFYKKKFLIRNLIITLN